MQDLADEGFTDPTEIGRGGFAVVFRVRQPAFNRFAALKIIESSVDEDLLLRYERECRALGSVAGHPHIVTLYDAGVTTSGRPYLAMEYLPGGSLAEQLAREGPRDWREAVSVGQSLAGALEATHELGVLHRDIKPANLLRSAYGTVKLGDFGIARIEGDMQTRSANVVASLAHAAPEVLAGQPPSRASDIYSLASTICTLLSGSPPFVRDGDESFLPLINRISREDLPDYREFGLPAPVHEMLSRAMAKDPEDRFDSAAEFDAALSRALRVGPGTAPPASAMSPAPAGGSRRPGGAGDGGAGPSSQTRLFGPRPEAARSSEDETGLPRAYLLGGTAAALVLALAGAGVFWALGSGEDPQETTPAATASDPGARPRADAEATLAPQPVEPVDLTPALLTAEEVPDRFGQGGTSEAGLGEYALCGAHPPVDSDPQQAQTVHAGGSFGPFLLHTVAAYPDEDAAGGAVDQLAEAGGRCSSYERAVGDDLNLILALEAAEPPEAEGIDQGIAFDTEFTHRVLSVSLPGRITVMQRGRFLAIVETIAERDGVLHGHEALVAAAADRLGSLPG